MNSKQNYTGLEIAIIGIACRFPDADNWREYWNNLINGIESIRFLSDEELISDGVNKDTIKHPNFVKAVTKLKKKNLFDSSFFDYTPSEAKLLNPQHRIFHECVWEALEDSGYTPEKTNGLIGLYAGAAEDLNWKGYSIIKNHNQDVDNFTLGHINNKDYLTSLISYKLNLKGPAFSVNTACSTSLVAINLACKSLLLGEVKMALAGGVSIMTEKRKGYFYEEGMVYSADGHCRAFDKAASGTFWGEGAGVIVLKRLADAINDKDHIYAIIKGGAINNDGNRKVGFTAPSVIGQADCIKKAQEFAKVKPDTISYIETHGTGTKLGDPIEIEALNIAFNKNKSQRCAIGSVKTNVGHLNTAAGIAGIIKAALSLKYKQLPPSLNFNEPNPEIDFDGGPFYVNTTLEKWIRNGDTPLRAGVSSFGIGGTNAHIILEEAPEIEESDQGYEYKILTLSAKTVNALTIYIDDLKNFLKEHITINMADLAYTLQVGRKHFGYRKSIIYRTREELILLLEAVNVKKQVIKSEDKSNAVVFMFTGQGSQYTGMYQGLYMQEPLFREIADRGFSMLKEITGEDFKSILFADVDNGKKINETRYAQPIIFLLEYSLTNLIMSYGIAPKYMIGHSIGEYVAACIGGVFSFEDALRLITKRGELMNGLSKGSMISVAINEENAKEYIDANISIAAVNSPQQVVLSGDTLSINELITKLDQLDINYVKLNTSHAFHSSMQDLILEEFRHELEKIVLNKSQWPIISNLTGEFLTEEQATSITYWTQHMRETVRFSKGIETLLSKEKELVFVEVGAGHHLTSLLKQQAKNPITINLVKSSKETEDDLKYLTNAIGQLWSCGVNINWKSYYQNQKRRRISLPTYSFEPISYPTEVNAYEMLSNDSLIDLKKNKKVNDWFYRVQWKQSIWLPGKNINSRNSTTILFSDNYGLGNCLKQYLDKADVKYITVLSGEHYERKHNNLYIVNSNREEDIKQLFYDLSLTEFNLSNIIHLWNYTNENNRNDGNRNIDFYQRLGYKSLLNIVRSFTSLFNTSNLQLDVVGNNWYSVLGNENIVPIKSTSLGAIKVIQQEFPNITCRAIDIIDTSNEAIYALWNEFNYVPDYREVAIRGKNRYVKDFEKIDFELPEKNIVLRKNGTYVITGASGGMGKLFAKYLADEFQANIILISRSERQENVVSELEEKGSKIFYIQSDITDLSEIKSGIIKAEEIFGSIHGVIHAAGIADYAGVILRRTIKDDEKIFAPKILGTQVLHSIFKNRPLDFFLNCSSIAATLGSFGQVAYVASNIYQDAFAESQIAIYPVISVQWAALKEVGMAVNSISHLSVVEQKNRLRYGISTLEAIKVLLAALHLKIPVQIISTKNLKDLTQRNKNDNQLDEIESQHGQIQERPELSTNYVTPNTETEKKLVLMLQNFLGINQIGIEDVFFELGGDSLKGMILLKRIKKEFNIDLTLKDFLENQTIKQMASIIDEINLLTDKKKRTSKIVI